MRYFPEIFSRDIFPRYFPDIFSRDIFPRYFPDTFSRDIFPRYFSRGSHRQQISRYLSRNKYLDIFGNRLYNRPHPHHLRPSLSLELSLSLLPISFVKNTKNAKNTKNGSSIFRDLNIDLASREHSKTF